MSGWGCPYEFNGICQRIKNRNCDPGMKGCILAGKFRFSDDSKNRPTLRNQQTKVIKSDAKDDKSLCYNCL